MRHVGIIAALPTEMEHILAAMTEVETRTYAHTPFYTGKVGKATVTLTLCGVGCVNAAIHTQVLVDRYPVEALICTGVAGSLSDRIPHLAMVVSEMLTFHDTDPKWQQMYYPGVAEFPADPNLVRLALASAGPEAISGVIVTGNRFVDSPAEKAELAQRFGAIAVEMEGAALAHTAYVNDLPFVVLRCISDMADGQALDTFQRFERLAAKKASDTVLRLLKQL